MHLWTWCVVVIATPSSTWKTIVQVLVAPSTVTTSAHSHCDDSDSSRVLAHTQLGYEGYVEGGLVSVS